MEYKKALDLGKELVDKVFGLIGVFRDPGIYFKNNRASGDDIIGDAYEYFVMKFVQESGKENGYTWHERNDMVICDLVPTKINRFFGHLGGVSECKKCRMVLNDCFAKRILM